MKDYNYWINPQGGLIKTPYMLHSRTAREILEKILPEKEFEDALESDNSMTDELHNRGWIRVADWGDGVISISGSCIDLTKPMKNTMKPAMNSKQMKVAKRLCKEHGTEFHKAINDKRFW